MNNAIEEITLSGMGEPKGSQTFQLDQMAMLAGMSAMARRGIYRGLKLMQAAIGGTLTECVSRLGGARAIFPHDTDDIHLGVCLPKCRFGIDLAPDGWDGVAARVRRIDEAYTKPKPGGYDVSYPPRANANNRLSPEKAIASWQFLDLADVGIHSPARGWCDADDNERLHEDGANIAAVLLKMKKEAGESFGKLIHSIHQLFPDIATLVPVTSCQDGQNMVSLNWKQTRSSRVFPATLLGESTIRLVCLFWALNQKDPPTTLVLNALERGLSPTSMRQLAKALRFASDNTQPVILSASPMFAHLGKTRFL